MWLNTSKKNVAQYLKKGCGSIPQKKCGSIPQKKNIAQFLKKELGSYLKEECGSIPQKECDSSPHSLMFSQKWPDPSLVNDQFLITAIEKHILKFKQIL